MRADRRGGGIGRKLMAYAIELARERGCRIVQLTTDKRRTDAHRFYEREQPAWKGLQYTWVL